MTDPADMERVQNALAIQGDTLRGYSIGRAPDWKGDEHIRTCGHANHWEKIQFLPLHSPQVPVVLGYSWLCRHNSPQGYSWMEPILSRPVSPVPLGPSRHTSSEEEMAISSVPREYLSLTGVFNKTQATSLPPHQP
ncbi:hypothetical protein DPEC_G00236790 [Dallia pectoralis]|uniref:Uncharacterized protein n=1 Tax=Dallia pectoralis TaxID=75939 RepID=A0ACC2FYV6_DALPE|nr:hypothetical protein DPEC_G00236790 [Dallia pectoralis]